MLAREKLPWKFEEERPKQGEKEFSVRFHAMPKNTKERDS